MVTRLLSEKGGAISFKSAINSGLQSIAKAASGGSSVELSFSSSRFSKGLFVSELCFFFLPYLGKPALTCNESENDWDVFLAVIDSQIQWIGTDATSEAKYGTILFKTLQLLLTQALASKHGTKPELRTKFGQVIKHAYRCFCNQLKIFCSFERSSVVTFLLKRLPPVTVLFFPFAMKRYK